MLTREPTIITVETVIEKNKAEVWSYWTEAEHIKQWNQPSEDWHTTKAENDVQIGGKFNSRMESKDGKNGFDFSGTYTDVVPEKVLKYTLDDGRKVSISFIEEGEDETLIIETFEAENQNSIEMQRSGWQAILDNFKQYTEAQ